jgi:hypothetical protein
MVFSKKPLLCCFLYMYASVTNVFRRCHSQIHFRTVFRGWLLGGGAGGRYVKREIMQRAAGHPLEMISCDRFHPYPTNVTDHIHCRFAP